MTDAEFEQAIAALAPWIGRKRVVEDEIGLTAVRRIAGMLDLDPDSFKAGTTLPPHWFTMFFADIAKQSQIGPDGHAVKGLFLPPIPLPRRMGAGRRVRVDGRLRAAEPARKIAEAIAITPKIGRSGRIAVLTMRHTIEAGGRTIAVDEFDAIYRDAVPAGQKTTATVPTPAPDDHEWEDAVELSEVLVFRYSAVTWNAHRIHYDADYTRGDEGYAHTVQNGGLTMQLMVDAALKRAPGELRAYTTRLTLPLWVGDTARFRGKRTGDGRVKVWVADKNGHLNGEMDLEFAT